MTATPQAASQSSLKDLIDALKGFRKIYYKDDTAGFHEDFELVAGISLQ